MPVAMRLSIVLAATLLILGTSCKPRPGGANMSADAAPRVKLTDLSASLDAIRTEFNAHKQEARFLTLLSPA